MNRIFPATKVYTTNRAQNPRTGQLDPGVTEYKGFCIQDDHEALISASLGERFGFWTHGFLANLTKDEPVWAAVFFTDTIKDSDAAMDARGELRSQLRFAPYGPAELGMSNPPLGALEVKSKYALKLAAERHPAFAAAWSVLEACSEHTNWVAMVEVQPGNSG